MNRTEGLIIKSVGGLFYAETSHDVTECKARGIFRKENISPCAGDRVYIDENSGEYVIAEILPRKNSIIRPPAANIDCLLFVVSTCEPEPNFLILDKFIAVAEYKKIEPAVIITKNDLKKRPDIEEIYTGAGYPVFAVDYGDEHSLDPVFEMTAGKICMLTGNTGAGKSTLLNHLDSSLGLATGEISKKLGRGRHTTRQAELFKLKNGGYIADTPGFSAFDTNRYDIIYKDELKYCFREFEDYNGKCRFPDCAHIGEKGCAAAEAAENGLIAPSRYSSYKEMYNEAKQLKEWEVRKNNAM